MAVGAHTQSWRKRGLGAKRWFAKAWQTLPALLQVVLQQLCVACAFLLLALFSLELGVPAILTRPIWLPAALLAALVLARGAKDQSGLVLGAALFGFWRYADQGLVGAGSIAINALAIFLQIHLAHFLFKRTLGAEGGELWRARDLVVAAIVAGPVMMSLKPLIVFPFLLSFELIPSDNLWDRAFDWIVADTMAAFLVAPMILVLVGRPRAWWRSRWRSLFLGQGVVVLAFIAALQIAAGFEGDRVHALVHTELSNRLERLSGKLEQLEEYGVPPLGGSRALGLVPLNAALAPATPTAATPTAALNYTAPLDPLILRLDRVPGWALDLARWSAEERALFAARQWHFLFGDTSAFSNGAGELIVKQTVLLANVRFRTALVLPPLAVRALVSKTLWWFQLAFSIAAILATLTTLRSSARRRLLEQRVAERTESLRDATHELALFKALADQATDPIIVAEPQASSTGLPILRYINPAFTQATQYGLNELADLNLLRGGTADAQKIMLLMQSLARGDSASAEFYHYRKDGSRYLAHVNAFPIFSEAGTITHWAGLYRDVTEERAREARARVDERFNQERERHEQIGRMAGGVAHDFNNLLTAVQGGVELIRLESGPHVAPDLLENIEQAVRTGAELTHQLLAFSGNGQGRMEVLELGARVRAVHKMLKMAIPASTLLTIKIAPGLHHVKLDPAWLTQILVNLVINGAQALQGQAGTVRVEIIAATQVAPPSDLGRSSEPTLAMPGIVSSHASAGLHVCLSVSDSGCGIAPELVQKVFEPFYTTKSEGTGLGLAAVAGVVRESGGWLTVRSNTDYTSLAEPATRQTTAAPGLSPMGTEFRVYLAAHDPDTDLRENIGVSNATSTYSETNAARSVLVVDDEPGVRAYVATVLRGMAWTVTTANNGIEAQSLLRQRGFNLLITDLTMPEMGGFALIDWLAQQTECPPIVVMSGYSQDRELLMQRHAQRVSAWLDKPFTVHALRAATESVLAANPTSQPKIKTPT